MRNYWQSFWHMLSQYWRDLTLIRIYLFSSDFGVVMTAAGLLMYLLVFWLVTIHITDQYVCKYCFKQILCDQMIFCIRSRKVSSRCTVLLKACFSSSQSYWVASSVLPEMPSHSNKSIQEWWNDGNDLMEFWLVQQAPELKLLGPTEFCCGWGCSIHPSTRRGMHTMQIR